MFKNLLKDGKFRTKQEIEWDGAKEFFKLFRQGGTLKRLFRRHIKTKEEMVALILNSGLASDQERAEEFLKTMLGKRFYMNIIESFELIELYSESEIKYEMVFSSPDE